MDSACTLEKGSSFTLLTIPSVIPVGGYIGFQTLLNYGELDYKPAAIQDEITWLMAFIPLRAASEGQVGHASASAIFLPFPVSVQKTALITLKFNCSGAGGAPIVVVG